MAELFNDTLIGCEVAIDLSNLTKKSYKQYVDKNERYWYGYVERVFKNDDYSIQYGVRVNNHSNGTSTGLFYFDIEQLITENIENLTTKKGEVINMKNLVLGDYRIVQVVFLDNMKLPPVNYRLYSDGKDYALEDIVVCKTKNHGMALGVIKGLLGCDDQHRVDTEREIVCKVDMDAYNARKKKVEEAVRLKVKIDEKVKQLQGLALYEMLGEQSPELKEMVESYKSLVHIK